MEVEFAHDDRKMADLRLHARGITKALESLLEEAENPIRCASCWEILPVGECDAVHVDMYDHEDGWKVITLLPRQWLSVHCRCGYDTSFTKLGVGGRRHELQAKAILR